MNDGNWGWNGNHSLVFKLKFQFYVSIRLPMINAIISLIICRIKVDFIEFYLVNMQYLLVIFKLV